MSIPRILEMGSTNLMSEVISALEMGEFVIVPTDTIYGIAVRADDPDAVNKLFIAKGRKRSKKLAYLVADADGMCKHLSAPPNKAVLLARRFWPGQLTLVVKDEDRTVGFRCPAYPFSIMLARVASFPIFLTSANVSGSREITSVFDVIGAKFKTSPAIIVDGGTTQYKKRSTVVLVNDDSVTLLRAGCIPASKIPFLSEI